MRFKAGGLARLSTCSRKGSAPSPFRWKRAFKAAENSLQQTIEQHATGTRALPRQAVEGAKAGVNTARAPESPAFSSSRASPARASPKFFRGMS